MGTKVSLARQRITSLELTTLISVVIRQIAVKNQSLCDFVEFNQRISRGLERCRHMTLRTMNAIVATVTYSEK